MTSAELTVTRHKGHGALTGRHDIAVVIDVIRAFTFAKVAFDRGVERILLAQEVEDARTLAAQHPGALLAGEVDALPIEGFDFGNSPSQISELDLSGMTLVHRTSNGTRMAIAALDCCREVVVTGLSNICATAQFIAERSAQGATSLLLVATHPTGDEDVACGDHLLDLLGAPDGIGLDAALRRTRSSEAAIKFLDPSQPRFPAEDMKFVLRRDPQGLPMRVRLEAGLPTVRR